MGLTQATSNFRHLSVHLKIVSLKISALSEQWFGQDLIKKLYNTYINDGIKSLQIYKNLYYNHIFLVKFLEKCLLSIYLAAILIID